MIYVKRGDTLQLIVSRKDENGQPLSGEAEFLFSQIRDERGVLLGEFVITETDVLGDYLFKIEADLIELFPIGTHSFDIEYRGIDEVYSTETMHVRVLMDVTHV